ncbi:RNA-directed DNA polymerase [Vibrio olivae]
MAQAWKKTHGYIRSFNWYADTLELDISALCIEQNAKKWATSVKRAKLNKLELVPAAKSEIWSFDKYGWNPVNIEKRQEKPPIRPLAHISIRDQTWASAAMLCLADSVESAQGDCSHKEQTYEQARYNKVYSYGNRLLCDWKNKNEAWFRWGNSETYRKFFTDYQNFLKRPVELGRIATEQATNAEEVFIVNLDLSKFYNTIDIDVLIERLKRIVVEFGYAECPKFWNAFKRITSWSWSVADLKRAELLKLGDIQKGLPQGLVSAGFYANAYLVNFDRELGNFIGKSQHGITLHDYCRYVDDIRLVISASDKTPSEISRIVNKKVNQILKEFGGPDLELNNDKTKVTLLKDLDNSGSMASRIEMIQSEMSGPADRDVLSNVSGMLESLLDIEDVDIPKLDRSHADSSLLQLSDYDHDIRPDTLNVLRQID